MLLDIPESASGMEGSGKALIELYRAAQRKYSAVEHKIAPLIRGLKCLGPRAAHRDSAEAPSFVHQPATSGRIPDEDRWKVLTTSLTTTAIDAAGQSALERQWLVEKSYSLLLKRHRRTILSTPFTSVTRVQIPSGTPTKFRRRCGEKFAVLALVLPDRDLDVADSRCGLRQAC